MNTSATDSPWAPISSSVLAGVTGLLILGIWMYHSNDQGWIRILDDANLVFHEAGHPIYGLLGTTLGLYGGTLGQLTIPVLCGVHFWTKRHTASLVLSLLWFFENFFNIARYMADARAQLLPLVGNGDHDWLHIFTNWGVLPHDRSIASGVRLIGIVGLLVSWSGLVYRWHTDRLHHPA